MLLLTRADPALEHFGIEQIVRLQPPTKELFEGRSLIEHSDIAIFEGLWLAVDKHSSCSWYEPLWPGCAIFGWYLFLSINHPFCKDRGIVVVEGTRCSLVERTIDDLENKTAERAVRLPPDGRELSEVPWNILEVLLLLVLLHNGFNGQTTDVTGAEILPLIVLGGSLIRLCRTDDKRIDFEF